MQIDCHYYAVYFLCIASGLSPADSRIIAYSSQHVDDASDGRPKELVNKRTGEVTVFDPIRTAHNGLESPGSDVHQKVYFPFHFLPGLTGNDYEERMTTRAGCSGGLFNVLSARAIGSGSPYSVGITAHVLADTFSHEGFSGSWTWVNDVDRVDFVPTSRRAVVNLWSSLTWRAHRAVLRLSPPIGHAQAGTLPDQPYARWRFRDHTGVGRTACNNDRFRRGLLEVYRRLIRPFAGKAPARTEERAICDALWNNVSRPGSTRTRCARWQDLITDLASTTGVSIPTEHLDYDKRTWEGEALGALFFPQRESAFWPTNGRLEVDSTDPLSGSDYFKFHQAAGDHRLFVLSELQAQSLELPSDPHAEAIALLTSQVLRDVQSSHERLFAPPSPPPA